MVYLTVLTNTSTLIITMNIDAFFILINRRIINACAWMAITLTCYIFLISSFTSKNNLKQIWRFIRSHSNSWFSLFCRHFFCTNPSQHVSHWSPQVLCEHLHINLSGISELDASQCWACPLHTHLPPIEISRIL